MLWEKTCLELTVEKNKMPEPNEVCIKTSKPVTRLLPD